MGALIDDISRVIASPVSRRRAFEMVTRAVGGAALASLGLSRAARLLGAQAGNSTSCFGGGVLCNGNCYPPGFTCCGNLVACNGYQSCCTNAGFTPHCCDKFSNCCGNACCPQRRICCGGAICCDERVSCCGSTCCPGPRSCCNGRCCPPFATCCGNTTCCPPGSWCCGSSGTCSPTRPSPSTGCTQVPPPFPFF